MYRVNEHAFCRYQVPGVRGATVAASGGGLYISLSKILQSNIFLPLTARRTAGPDMLFADANDEAVRAGYALGKGEPGPPARKRLGCARGRFAFSAWCGETAFFSVVLLS